MLWLIGATGTTHAAQTAAAQGSADRRTAQPANHANRGLRKRRAVLAAHHANGMLRKRYAA